MAHGRITNVSPGGVLTIWSSTHGRYRFFAKPLADINLLNGLSVEFEPAASKDLEKISIVYGEGPAKNLQTRPMFAFISRIGELITGSSKQPEPTELPAIPVSHGPLRATKVSASVELTPGDADALNRVIGLLER